MNFYRLAISFLVGLLFLSGGCATTGGDSGGGNADLPRFSDLKSGKRIAGIPIGEWKSLPSEAELRALPIARYTKSIRKESPLLVLEGIERGDFEELRVEYDEVLRQNRGGGALALKTVALGVIAKPRWRNSDAVAQPEPLPGQVASEPQPPVRPATVALELARFGLTLGEPCALSLKYGPIFRTSDPACLALLERDAKDQSLRLAALASAQEEYNFLHNDHSLPFDELEEKVQDWYAERDLEQILKWKKAAREGALLGAAAPAAIFTALEHRDEGAVSQSLARYRENYDAAGPKQRLLLARELAVEGMQAARRSIEVPTAAVLAMRRCYQDVEQSMGALAREAEQAAHALEAQTFALLARTLREDRSLAGAGEAGAVWGEHLKSIPDRIDGCVWVLDELEKYKDKNLVQRLELHVALRANPPSLPMVAPDFVAIEQGALIDLYAEAGIAAEKKGLYASACARLLIADALGTKGPWREARSETLAGARERVGLILDSREIPVRLTQSGIALAARLVPLVGSIGIVDETRLADDETPDVLFMTPFADAYRLGLHPGDAAARAEFASREGAPLLRIVMSHPAITAVNSSTRTDSLSQTIVKNKLVSNEPAVQAWAKRRAEIANALDQRSGDLVPEPTKQYEWVTEKGILQGNTWSIYRESDASFKARLDRAFPSNAVLEKERRMAEERKQLLAEAAELDRNRPDGTAIETTSRVVEYKVEVQEWRIDYTVEIEVEGAGPEVVKMPITWQATLQCNRVAADPSNEIEALDGWTTEEKLRADPKSLESAEFVRSHATEAVRRWLAQRLEDYANELLARELSSAERAAEIRWAIYFFTPASEAGPDSPAGQQRAVIDLAFK